MRMLIRAQDEKLLINIDNVLSIGTAESEQSDDYAVATFNENYYPTSILGRYSTEEKAIKVINRIFQTALVTTDFVYQMPPDDADWLDEEYKQENAFNWSGWISVKDELPDTNDIVMVSIKGRDVPDFASYDGKKWKTAYSYLDKIIEDQGKTLVDIGLTITAWMPLPKVYKES